MKNTRFIVIGLLFLASCGESQPENQPTESQTTGQGEEQTEPGEAAYEQADSWLDLATQAADTYCHCIDSTGSIEDCYWEFTEAGDAVDSLKQAAETLGTSYNADYLEQVDKLSGQVESCQMSGLIEDRVEEVFEH